MAMSSRDRVLAALRREEPDRVPYCELGVDRALAQTLMGWGEPVSQAANLEANIYSVGVLGGLCLSKATLGVGIIAEACLLGILARIAQAAEQQGKLADLLVGI